MRRVLMIAFHFPPLAGSSGVQRTLRFARHLPRFGWEPLVLTAHPRAYERTSDDQMSEVPEGCIVERAFAVDAVRLLAVRGRYPGFVARPDRWASWWLGAVPRGRSMIRRFRPSAIWSTYPIATAHRIARSLHRLSRLPWLADFRDPMAQDGYPADAATWRAFKRIEERALAEAAASVFVTPGAAHVYRERYPHAAARVKVIENGYDEDSFTGLESRAREQGPLAPGAFTVVHSGIVYPAERDPTQLLQALRSMLDSGCLRPGELRLRLRASANEASLSALIARHRVHEVVELAPPIPYREALLEMLRADGLLLLQAANCNDQIPAKAYEYLRCRRPVIALTDPRGDTADLMRRAGVGHIARLDSAADIAVLLRRFIEDVRRGDARATTEETVARFSRIDRARELARALEEAAA